MERMAAFAVFDLPSTSNVLMSDAPSLVAPRKALRSCPTSLARLSALSHRCVQTARDSLCRSHPFSDVPCRSSSSPRALPRTRTAFATRIRKWYFAFTRFAEKRSRSPLFRGQAVSPRNVFRRVTVPRTLGAWCMLRARPARGSLAASAPSSLACPCSFASTSSSTSIRASPPRPHRDPRRSPTSERDQRHVVPTSAAHILSLSKTSSAHASRVTTGFTTPSFRPFHSPMECPVSRRAHPASAGLPCMRSSIVLSLRTQKTVPLTPRHFPGHPDLFRPFLRLRPQYWMGSRPSRPPKLASTAPPCRRALCPEPGRLPPTRSPGEGAPPHPSHALSTRMTSTELSSLTTSVVG